MTTGKNLPENITRVLKNISELHGEYEDLIEIYRARVDHYNLVLDADAARRSTDYWITLAFFNSLIRVRLLIEQNFNYVETLGLLSVSRYLFELTVWLRLLSKDESYGLVYLSDLIRKGKTHCTDMRNHLEEEIRYFEQIQQNESERIAAVAQHSATRETATFKEDDRNWDYRNFQKDIDDEAARKFCLHFDEATINGYGLQAHLLTTQAIPKLKNELKSLDDELRRVEAIMPKNAKQLSKERWNWKANATKVGMMDEYEFIYTYCSRLLHAAPISVTTDQKDLEHKEIYVFLRYTHLRMRGVLELAVQQRDLTSVLH